MDRKMVFGLMTLGGRAIFVLASLVVMTVFMGIGNAAFADAYYVWEKVEITLHAEKSYENP